MNKRRWIFVVASLLFSGLMAHGQEDPPWAAYYRPDGLGSHHELRCLKTGRTWKPTEEPKRDNLLGTVKIMTRDLWPQMGDTLMVELQIGLLKDRYKDGVTLLPPLENVELFYELKARPGVNHIPIPDPNSTVVSNYRDERSKVHGLIVGETPKLSGRLFQGDQTIYIQVPVKVLDNQEPQELLLYVCAYQNGTLVDWRDDQLDLCFQNSYIKDPKLRQRYLDRVKPTDLPGAKKNPVYLHDAQPREEQKKGQ